MTLTAEEAQIVLVALDVCAELGWDGAPSKILLVSAISKLEEIAGDQAEVRPLRAVEDA